MVLADEHPSNIPTPTPTPAEHAGRLAEQAESRLRTNSYYALKQVSCECRHGTLILRGSLPSYYLKQIAQEMVVRLDGVTQVVNQIAVVPPPDRPHPC